MKKATLLFLVLFGCEVTAQPVDSLRHALAVATEDSAKVDLLKTLSFYEQDFRRGLALAQQGLELAKRIGYEKGEGSCYFEIANLYMSNSNNPMALHYFLEALKVFERLGVKAGTGACYIAIGSIYQEQSDYENALVYLRRAEAAKPDNINPSDLQYGSALLYSNFGDVFLLLDKPDSALRYYQRSYECFTASDEKYQLNVSLNGLGDVQFAMGNTALAVGYYREALRNGVEFSDTLGMSASYLGLAKLYDANGLLDSSIVYGERAMLFAQRANVLKNIIESGKLLARLYKGKNDRAALRFLLMAQAANDSLYNRQRMAEVQNLFIGEREREEDNAERALREAERRRHFIEYSAIAIGIVTFIILFLLLSRSIIVSERMISFLGVLGLLVVFEFINLLLHPSLVRVTQESPVLLLLAYVMVAAALIPIHHKLEKRILATVIEKNRKIRLENARRTIRELEEKEAAKKVDE